MITRYLIPGVAITCLALGWTLCSWFEDSKDLAAQNERDEIMTKIRANELVIASHVEERLQELKANERIIENHTKEVIERPVYRNVCLDDDGVRIIDSYALGNTAELIGEMSRNLPKINGKTGADVVLMARQWSSQYHECKTIHNGLVDAISNRPD